MADDKKTMVADGHLRSFGRLGTRMSVADVAKLEERLEPYAFYVPAQGEQPALPAEDVPLVLEVGMGNGIYLFNRASNNRDQHHIGVEVYRNGLKSLVNKLEEREKAGDRLNNIQICSTDARDVLTSMPNARIDELVVLYADPWPKEKHKKRRIIQADFVEQAARIIKPGGKFFLATDIYDYAFHMLKVILADGRFYPLADGPDSWGVQPQGWTSTKYEQKAIKAGRKLWYLQFERVAGK